MDDLPTYGHPVVLIVMNAVLSATFVYIVLVAADYLSLLPFTIPNFLLMTVVLMVVAHVFSARSVED